MSATDDPAHALHWELVSEEVARQAEVDIAPVPSAQKVAAREQIRTDIDGRLSVDTQSRPDHPPS